MRKVLGAGAWGVLCPPARQGITIQGCSCQTGEMSPAPPSVRVVLIALFAVVTPKLLDGRGILNVPAPGPHGVITSSTSAPLEKHDGQSIRALRTIVG